VFLVVLQAINVWPRPEKNVKLSSKNHIKLQAKPTPMEQHGDEEVWEFGDA
jgi:hypothetical protein